MDISILKDQVIKSIEPGVFNQELLFTLQDGRQFKMFHEPDCCESVTIEEIIGDLSDLVGHPVLTAEERISIKPRNDITYTEEGQWTFYELATIKGSVTLRWYGESNYYSLSVDFEEIK